MFIRLQTYEQRKGGRSSTESIYGSTALSWSFSQSVGIVGQGISPSQGRYLRIGQHENRINVRRHPCFKLDPNSRSECWAGEDRPRDHYERLRWITVDNKGVCAAAAPRNWISAVRISLSLVISTARDSTKVTVAWSAFLFLFGRTRFRQTVRRMTILTEVAVAMLRAHSKDTRYSIKYIHSDSNVLSGFPWPVNGNSDNNLESLCTLISFYIL
jgi:hypothetical protein